jgi:hypothetical protein
LFLKTAIPYTGVFIRKCLNLFSENLSFHPSNRQLLSLMSMFRAMLMLATVVPMTCFWVVPAAPSVVRGPMLQRSPAATMRSPKEMDEGTFGFNKAVIDTVYDFICLIYDKNDLEKHSLEQCVSRFYVLETVARVPYFAYLSVMHLKESLGSRVPGDKERMRTHYAE